MAGKVPHSTHISRLFSGGSEQPFISGFIYIAESCLVYGRDFPYVSFITLQTSCLSPQWLVALQIYSHHLDTAFWGPTTSLHPHCRSRGRRCPVLVTMPAHADRQHTAQLPTHRDARWATHHYTAQWQGPEQVTESCGQCYFISKGVPSTLKELACVGLLFILHHKTS